MVGMVIEMKKIFLLIVLICILLCGCNFETEEFIFELTEDENGYVLTHYFPPKDFDGEVSIPAYHNDLPVVEIGNAFDDSDKVLRVIIPDTVKVIGGAAFQHCSTLEEVVIPLSVEIIEDYAFENCDGLTEICIPQTVSIGFSCFANCDGLVEISIGTERTAMLGVSIGKWAFNSCSNLEKVTLGQSITTIGENAFEHCERLQSVYLSSRLVWIQSSAFEYCKELETIVYDGSSDDWSQIEKDVWWNLNTGSYTIEYLK